MEDIKALFNETSELASDIGDLTIAWAKKKGHNPNLILKIVGDGLVMSSKIGNFTSYHPKYSGVLRAMNNKELADFLSGLVNDFRIMDKEIMYEQLEKEAENIKNE